MNRTKKITLKHKAKQKKAKPKNGNKPAYISKAQRAILVYAPVSEGVSEMVEPTQG